MLPPFPFTPVPCFLYPLSCRKEGTGIGKRVAGFGKEGSGGFRKRVGGFRKRGKAIEERANSYICSLYCYPYLIVSSICSAELASGSWMVCMAMRKITL